MVNKLLNLEKYGEQHFKAPCASRFFDPFDKVFNRIIRKV